MPCPVYLLHDLAQRHSRTVQLRVYQLAQIAQRYLAADYDVQIRAVPIGADDTSWRQDIRDGVVVASIGAAGHLSAADCAALANTNQALVADWHTGHPFGAGQDHLDLNVFGTLTAYRAARKARPGAQNAFLTQGVDLRLRPGPALTEVEALWPGDPTELTAYPDLSSQVAHARDGIGYADLLPLLPEFNLHLLSKSCQITDLFAAAHAGAVAIVPRNLATAIDYLGYDYPFYAQSDDPDHLMTALQEARAAFGSVAWRCAAERMRNTAERTSPGSVASDLDRILGLLAKPSPSYHRAA